MSTAIAERGTALSESGKRSLARQAGAYLAIAAGVVMLIVGIFIGNAARKKIDRWSHGIS